MNLADNPRWLRLAPAALAALGLALLGVWLTRGPDRTLALRVPGTDAPPGADATTSTNAVLAGKLIPGDGKPATDLPGAWPGFRGPKRDGMVADPKSLARAWDPAGPRELWSVELGEGYAGPAVRNGRVYLMDYDREKKQDALRCLSLADGREIWRFAYPVSVKRNHGMSRTTPAVNDRFVVALGPKCHVVCLDAVTGALVWGMDLVKQLGATVPPWYAGQCPLLDGDRVILAPGGNDALLVAVELATGKILWQTPNPSGWKMTHSSIAPMDFAGQRQFVYCASRGVVGVSATNGALLWQTTDWKISIATVPSPAILDGGRIFLSGGYNAGALLLQLKAEGGKIIPQTVYRLDADTFGATQHTPVLDGGYLYGVRWDGRFVCLDPAGKIVWVSDPGTNFGLGPFLVAGDLIYAMNDSGKLTLLEASPAKYTPLASAQVLKGRDSWAPMALVGGRLLARDLTRLVCLDVAAK
ncbi:MAG: PQQ-binding-like beta-propeller repeat protein [Verrucomicrobiota bacterium]|jgi:outer membrane protein assembly factor BamB